MDANEHGSNEPKDLTVSAVDRQNILNNPYALQEIEKAAEIKGIPFEGLRCPLRCERSMAETPYPRANFRHG